jgi:pimeloyl-ACP methyl ester carboxylesterase/uncharacterized membrane protein HdeD (DUF308 family)
MKTTRLNVRIDIGSGEPLVLLHGMFADGTQWNQIAKLLSSDFRVIVVDLLGHGKSPRPKGATYSDKEHVFALRSTLESLNATHNSTIVGYSMGGAVALAYSSTYPQSVVQLYLISTPFYLTPEEMIPMQYAGSLLYTKLSTSLFNWVEQAMNPGHIGGRITDFGNKSKKFHAVIGANENQLDPDIIRKNLITLVHQFKFTAHLKKLKVPVTFFAGKKDVFIAQGQLDALRQYQPNMDIQRLDIIKIDHMLVQNLPHEIARLLLKNKPNLLNVGFDGGKGEPIVLLNGIESSTDYWQPLIPSLLKHNRVIAIDLLGFGGSPKPLNIAYTLEEHAQWLKRTIDSLGLNKVTLVGHSLGALVALTYASQHKTKVRGLTLLSPVFVPKKGAKNQIIKRINFVEKISEGSNLYSRTAKALGYRRISEYLPLIRSVKNGVQHQNMKTILRTLNMPITILYGRKDNLIDKDYLKLITKPLKKGAVIELNAGHNFPFFKPKETIEKLGGYSYVNTKANKAGILPRTFLKQLVRLAAPILLLKGFLYVGAGTLLFTHFSPWVITFGLCVYIFRLGYSYIRGSFSLKNENLSYYGYVLLGITGMLLSFFLIKQPELALKISVIVISGLTILSGLSKLIVALLWSRQQPLRRSLLIKGTAMVIIGISALFGSIASVKLIVAAIATLAIINGTRFIIYAISAVVLAYVRSFKSQ